MKLDALEPPATPILLYIGAGYDLSPLLTFAPGGSPYPIAPLRPSSSSAAILPTETYTSFIFVDAKPRHTSAFMIPDYDEWEGIDERVRNVLHYSQGLLTRWRTVPGAPDLIWFEGGGHTERDHQWHQSTTTTTTQSPSPRPLTTLFYLFNTLDLELTRAPLMENMWPRVQALYVHGLRIHRNTGAGMSSLPNFSALGVGLKRCYVLVGSWRGKAGVRNVDFVKEARRRRKDVRLPLPSSSSSSSADRPSSASTSSSAFTSSSALSCPTPSPASSSTSLSLAPSLKLNPSLASSRHSFHHGDSFLEIETAYYTDTDSDSDDFDLTSTTNNNEIEERELKRICPQYSSTPFHIPIPQLSYSHTLQRYYVARTIPECVALVKAKGKPGGGDSDTYSAYACTDSDDNGAENRTAPRLQRRDVFGGGEKGEKEKRRGGGGGGEGRRGGGGHNVRCHWLGCFMSSGSREDPRFRITVAMPPTLKSHKVVYSHSKKTPSRVGPSTHCYVGAGERAGVDADGDTDPLPLPNAESESRLGRGRRPDLTHSARKKCLAPSTSTPSLTASLLAWFKGGVSVSVKVGSRNGSGNGSGNRSGSGRKSGSGVILIGPDTTASRTTMSTDARTSANSTVTNMMAIATIGNGWSRPTSQRRNDMTCARW